MCGIFGYIGKNNNSFEIVYNGLKSLEYRGYDSWGIASILSHKQSSGKKMKVIKKVGKISEYNKFPIKSSMISLGHTRWATHGGVTEKNAHPHTDCNNRLAVIHNGIIENYEELKRGLIIRRHKFVSDTDSEVAGHLIEEYLKKSEKKGVKTYDGLISAVRSAFTDFEGLNALIVADAETECFVACKNGSPLVVGKGNNENVIASDAHALLPYTREVYFMEDNDLIFINNSEIKLFDIQNSGQKKITYHKLDWDIDIEDKGKLPHFMLKEIYEQPKVIENILKNKDREIKVLADAIKKSYGCYFVGCGSAAYACLAGTYIFSKVTKRHVNFSVASEFGYLVDFLKKDSLVISLSQSGETIDLIDAVRKAKRKNAQIAGILNVLGSSLYRLSDYRFMLDAGSEKAVVSTKAFTAKLAVLILLAYQCIDRLDEGKQILKKSVADLKNIFSKSQISKLKKIAKNLKNEEHIYLIGRGISYPIALECALKIKEASYIHAEGFAGGELKHGVIALIEKNTPCISVVLNDETKGDVLAGTMEMKARGGKIFGITPLKHEIFDETIEISDSGIASIIPSVVIGQLLGYFLAVERGYDPDKPRNLAKSVTVK